MLEADLQQFHPLVQYLPIDAEEDDSRSDSPLLASTSDQTNANMRLTTEKVRRQSDEQECPDLETANDSYATPDDYSQSERDLLLLQAFKHEALRRRAPIIWLPEDELGITADEINHMPAGLNATMMGARLSADGKVTYEGNPPDYIPSDDVLL